MKKRPDTKVRTADPPPEARTEDSGGFHASVDWMMAGLLLGGAGLAVWYFKIAWNFDFDSRDFSPIVFVPVIVGGYGLYYFVGALRGTLRGRKFGTSTLAILGGEVRMGTTLKGVIRTSVELHPQSDYEIRLQCIETFAMAGSGETDRNVDRIRWEASTKVAPAAVSSKEGIPFEFTLPEPFSKPGPSKSGSVETSWVASISIPGFQDVLAHNRSPDATRWIVTIDAPLDGIDYHAIFGVIVKGSTRDGGSDIVLLGG
jgi:hypothetical protein